MWASIYHSEEQLSLITSPKAYFNIMLDYYVYNATILGLSEPKTSEWEGNISSTHCFVYLKPII